MTVMTTASGIFRGPDLQNAMPVPHIDDVVGEPDEQMLEHARSIAVGDETEPDPDARMRMASMLYAATGWDIFPEIATDREYVSRLWAEDWDSPEDAIYDTD